MAVNNFKPVLWSKKILKELDKKQILVNNCSQDWSGEIKGVGSKVKINSINEPTIGDYVPNVTVITPEEIKDESRMLEITEAKYFAYILDDVDEKQATDGVFSEANRKAIIGLKNASEAFVAGKFSEGGNTVTELSLTTGNFYSTMMAAKEYLMENNAEDEEICLELNPAAFTKGVLANIVFNQQDNGDMITKGTYSQLLGMMVYVSNNIPQVRTDQDIVQATCVMRTKQAIAYAQQIMKTSIYEPESSFSKAQKGLHVYGAKTVKPREMVTLVLKTAAETTI